MLDHNIIFSNSYLKVNTYAQNCWVFFQINGFHEELIFEGGKKRKKKEFTVNSSGLSHLSAATLVLLTATELAAGGLDPLARGTEDFVPVVGLASCDVEPVRQGEPKQYHKKNMSINHLSCMNYMHEI